MFGRKKDAVKVDGLSMDELLAKSVKESNKLKQDDPRKKDLKMIEKLIGKIRGE